jgi:hypothetical protein
MGFLNLLRVPESVDRDSGGLPELALVRSLRLQLNRKHNYELKEPYSKKNKQPPEVVEVPAAAPSHPRPDARLQHVAVQLRTDLHSPESTRERLGMKTGGRPTFPEMSHSKLGK